MRYSVIFHELKMSEISHGISCEIIEISDSSILSTVTTMAKRMLNIM